ncbi:MAG: hypothetical protein WB783_18785 [Arenicellales bacterium]
MRSSALDLVRGGLGTVWIYVVAPILGALMGVGFEWILKGKPTTAGAGAAQRPPGVDDSTPTRARQVNQEQVFGARGQSATFCGTN